MNLTATQLKALESRKITKTALAQQIGVSSAYLSRNTPKLPPGPVRAQRIQTHKLFETRRIFRTKLANQVISGNRTLESAAKQAHCSIRTMYRYVCKLKK